MTDLIAAGTAWLAAKLKSHASQTVTYSRSGESDLTLLATIGETEFETEDDFGALIKVQSRDFIISAADLDFGVGAVEPARNDQIKETVGGSELVYEVLPFGGGKQLWRYSDGARTILRIHTKRF